MENVKVLGASDRNVKALKMAMTIKGPETKNGKVISDMQLAESPVPASTYPFKMSIKNDEGKYYLLVSEGRIGVTDWCQANSYLECVGENAIDLSVLSMDQEYAVVLAVESDTSKSQNFKSYVYFMNNNKVQTEGQTLVAPPYTRGIFTTILGVIERKTINDGSSSFVSYAIKKQDTIGNLNFDFSGIRYPFSVYAVFKESPHGKFIDTPWLRDKYQLHIQEGRYQSSNNISKVGGGTVDPEYDNAFIWFEGREPVSIRQGDKFVLVNVDNSYNYLIAEYHFGTDGSVWINQSLVGDVHASLDEHKVKVNGVDMAGYLDNKFKFQLEVDQLDYEDSYIGVFHDSESIPTLDGASNQYAKNWKLRPTFVWREIEGWDEDKEESLVLSYDKKQLKWTSVSGLFSCVVEGSIDKYFEFKENSDDMEYALKWKLDGKSGGKGGLLGVDSGNGAFTLFELNASKDSVLTWTMDDKPKLIAPPGESNEAPSGWVFSHVGSKGFTWLPYGGGSTSGAISGGCSGMVAIQEGDEPDYLSTKLQESNSIGWTVEGSFMAPYINPDFFFSSDESIVITSSDNGLDFTVDISNVTCSGLVAIQDGDKPDYLSNKIYSSNESINFETNHYVGDKLALDISVNTDKFISSDESISIEVNDEGVLDFTVQISGECSGLVKVNEDDELGYLEEKLEESPSITWTNNGNFLAPGINPEFFFSSDDSVKIEGSETGIDLTAEGIGKVAVQEGDEPDYLEQKLQDSPSIEWINGGEFLIGNIVSDYFTSEDESVKIIDTGSGLDFSAVGNGMVALNEDDDPDYLANKIYSSNESILFETNHYVGDGNALDISVNTDKFISSDESISIIVDENGVLDFSVSGEFKVKINEEGEEGYLSEKLVDSNSIYWTTEDDTMKPEIDGSYFYSSDESILITETEDGLDFQSISSAIVSVQEGGEAGYLSEKLGDSPSIRWEIEDDMMVPHIEPDYFFSSDESVSIEATTDGIDLKIISSALVIVDEGGDAGTLSEKLVDSDSIYWTIEDDTMKPEIQPGYFFSSDETVTITETDEGLDFSAGGGKVAVQEGDEPDYLEQKLQDSPSIEWINGGSFMIANIVADYFFSSDESITITATDNGLDFVSLGSGKVAVEEGDEPDYLINKLDSDLGTIVIENKGTYVNLDISEALLGSSDETISVEWIDGSFDLKMNIEPILEKFTSDDGSITIERSDDKVNFEVSESLIGSSDGTITVEYSDGNFDLSMSVEEILKKFSSDDGSITIEATEDNVNLEVSEGLIGSSDGTITVEYSDGNFDLSMSIDAVLEKFTSDDGSISISRSDDGVNLEVSEGLIGSSDGTITVDYSEGTFDLVVDLTPLLEKFISNDGSISISASEDEINLEVSSSLIYSSDGTITVEHSDGSFDLAVDITPILEKLKSEDGSITISKSGEDVNFELNKSIFTSEDGSVKITTGNGKVDFSSGGGKVAVQEGDEPDYLANKIEIDESLAGLIQIENTGEKLLLKSALDGNGILLVNNGNISVLPTGSGDCVLGMKGGQLQWIPVASCESACGGDEE